MNRLRVITTLATLALAISATAIDWFDGRKPVSFTIEKGHEPVVDIAAQLFSDDMRKATGMAAEQRKKGATITVRLDPTLGDDAFRVAVEQGKIVVSGGNGRGMAYGLLEMSRLAGVSPLTWWGDSYTERKTVLTLPDNYRSEQRPSVEFRGFFVNDEDWSSRQWSHTTVEPSKHLGEMGPATYRHFFELLLRLRGNTVWPAMHEGTTAFFKVKGNKELADSFGIVVGTSHCEPMLRNNVGEWNKEELGDYNFISNRQAVVSYWAERLEESRGGQYIYTVGMRGIHDGKMEGTHGIDEQTRALQDVIDTQRQLIAKHVNPSPSRVPQMFVPYKEVLAVMENGLRLPDDITIMWCDDNYGYITRLGDASHQQRSGGAGVYYHLSYWGRPHDYLWLTTTQPGLIYHQMRTAYDKGARRIWIANIHDPKVAAYHLELFLDMAWQIDRFSGESIEQHLSNWLCREFGSKAAQQLLPAMRTFFRLCCNRRPEFMGWSQTELNKKQYARGLSPAKDSEFTHEFGDELNRYLSEYENICRTVGKVKSCISSNRLDAYFAAIEYPVLAASAMAHKQLEAQLARQSADSAEARRHADASTEAYRQIVGFTSYYNKQLAGGKWQGLMDCRPRRLPVFDPPAFEKTHPLPSPDTTSQVIARNASDGITLRHIQMLGHSMSAVPLTRGETVEYPFTARTTGEATVSIGLVPTHPSDGGNLRFSVQIDDGEPVVMSLKEPFRSERWKLNVLRGQALKQTKTHIEKGNHTLRIKAIDEGIVLDQWMIDFADRRPFYLIPANSNF